MNKTWNQSFEELQKFVHFHGQIPKSTESNWPSNQRSEYKKGKLSQEQIEKLESIPGWWWSQKKTWDENFQKLKDFVHENGRFPKRKEFRWSQEKRSQYKEGKLTQEKIQKLESIPGWYWYTR